MRSSALAAMPSRIPARDSHRLLGAWRQGHEHPAAHRAQGLRPRCSRARLYPQRYTGRPLKADPHWWAFSPPVFPAAGIPREPGSGRSGLRRGRDRRAVLRSDGRWLHDSTRELRGAHRWRHPAVDIARSRRAAEAARHAHSVDELPESLARFRTRCAAARRARSRGCRVHRAGSAL